MAIGRLYYTLAALFLCSLYCHSHYEAKYPERGYAPWSGWGNKWRRAKEDKEEAERRKARKEEAGGFVREKAGMGRRLSESLAREAESEGRRVAREVESEAEEIARYVGRNGGGSRSRAGDPRRRDGRGGSGSGGRRSAGHGWWEGQGQGQGQGGQETPLRPLQRWR